MPTWLFRFGLAGFLALGTTTLGLGAEKQELRWRFKRGQKFHYVLKQREVRTASVGDRVFDTTTQTDYEWLWTVQDVDEQGMATLELKLTGLRVASNGKDFDFQYDSARGNEAPGDYKKKLIRFYDQLRFTS